MHRNREIRHLYRQPRRGMKSGLAPGTPVFVGERKQTESTLSVMRYSREEFEEIRDASAQDCLRLSDKEGMCWINIDGVHDISTIETIGRRFNLHPLTLEDIVNTGHRPKAEEFDHYLYMIIKVLTFDEERATINIENISLILADNLVLSFQEHSGDLFDGVRERIRKGKGKLRASGADFLAYSLLDAVVDDYFVVMEQLGDRIEALDDAILRDARPLTMDSIHYLKRELLFLRKSVWPLREELSRLERTESPLMGATTRTFLRDVHDHTIQVIDMIETYRDIIGGMHDTYLSSVSNRMNEIMKVLTIIATIFIPLTFISGIYGMNFDHMPELHWHYGYFAVLGVMAGVGIGLLLYFRHRNWL